MNKRYYAAKYKDGTFNIFYDTWNSVKPKLQGVSGVIFKGFDSREELKVWLEEILQYKMIERTEDTPFVPDMIYLFTDGSNDNETVSWAWVAVCNNKKISEDRGTGAYNKSRNVAGEIEAAVRAIKWFVATYPEDQRVVIVHDYIGLSMWMNGQWGARSEQALYFLNELKPLAHRISWEKVKGHSGVTWNEYVDKLAYRR